MHLKREKSPKHWPIERKGTTYLVKPSYGTREGIPILLIIRDMLKLSPTRRGVKKAINSGQILLDKKEVSNEANSAFLFDVITIKSPKGSSFPEKNYRIVIGENKKFDVEEIDNSESEKKISKVINKKTLKGKKTQINLSDGRNFISDLKCKVNDSVLINLKNRKIEKVLPLKKEVKVIVFAGKHAGEKGTVKEIDDHNKIVKLDSDGKGVNVLIKQIMVKE